MLFELQGPEEENRGKEGAQAGVPNKAARDVNKVRIEGPDPASSDGNAAAKTDLRDAEERQTDQRGKQSIQTENDEGGCLAVDAEKFENAGEKIGINRSEPGRRTSVHEKRVAEALAFGDGTRDAAGFEAEPQMVFILVPRAVIEKTHGHKAQREGEEEDRQR